MEFEIWQAPPEQAFAAPYKGGYEPGFEWKPVWKGETDPTKKVAGLGVLVALDAIYTQFQRVDENHMPPEEYTGRSLTAGDLIAIENGDGKTWWYCALTGWDQVEAPDASA